MKISASPNVAHFQADKSPDHCGSRCSTSHQLPYRLGLLFLHLFIPAAIVTIIEQVQALQVDQKNSSTTEQISDKRQISNNLRTDVTKNAAEESGTIAGTRVTYIAQALSSSNVTAYYGYDSQILSIGDEGENVRQIQLRLRELGYYYGSVDGIYGSQTQEAVQRFQSANGLYSDGVVGEDTRLALYGSGTPVSYDDPGYSPTNPTYPYNPSSGQLGYCPNPQNFNGKRYIVLIPDNGSRLAQVRQYQYFRDAFVARSPLGTYIQAGACTDQGLATNRIQFLRRQGFKDAQVRYF